MNESKCTKSNNGEHQWVENVKFGRVCKLCDKIEVTVAEKKPILSPFWQEFQEEKSEENLNSKELEYILKRTQADGVVVISFKNGWDIYNTPMKISSLGVNPDQIIEVIEQLKKIKKEKM